MASSRARLSETESLRTLSSIWQPTLESCSSRPPVVRPYLLRSSFESRPAIRPAYKSLASQESTEDKNCLIRQRLAFRLDGKWDCEKAYAKGDRGERNGLAQRSHPDHQRAQR